MSATTILTTEQAAEAKTTAEILIEKITNMTPEEQLNALYLIEGVGVGSRAAEKKTA